MNPSNPFSQVTRFELIDSGGRRIVLWDPSIKLTVILQDEGRTLKVFAEGDVSARWMSPLDHEFAGRCNMSNDKP